MASVRVAANHGAGSRCPPPWKLYHNPHYSPRGIIHLSSSPRPPRQAENLDSPMIVVPEDGGEEAAEIDQGYGAMSSELELCVARIRGLRAELELERRMRRKAEALSEALAAELAEERRRGEAAEAECRALREEAGAAREEAERVLEGVEEERRMLRVAELWREERVQMKLADARAAMEEKLREIDDAVAELHATTAAASDNHKSSSCCGRSCSPNGKASPTSQHGQQSPSRSQHGQESPSRGQHGQLHRREAAGGENPHIRRGIKGFVEFPKAVRVRPREDRADLVSNLECQRAQLRVLMRHRSPAGGMGLVGASENLVV
ncbi:protein BRANCHLESS TRICHOME-like [Panicum virgatum]|uniref:Uncharacterized protein n=1 Tax=Panicum virgatum TaxID=38727 RepID=A0A8T0MQE8_PANVG|nr:protein BRANCHLESS TRICHOME-like [Panicum virgatum]KAG2539327.1 hypothetical protein PVAP13_9NG463100 [Panicum virgatum]